MGFTAPVTRATDFLVTAAIWNAEHVDNFNTGVMHLIARKASDQIVSSTTLASDDTLFTPSIPANEVWYLRLIQSITTGAGGMKAAWQIPTSSEIQRLRTGLDDGGVLVAQTRQTASDTPTLAYIVNSTNPRLYVEELFFINAATAGAVTFRFALTTASGTSTTKANSTLWGVKLA